MEMNVLMINYDTDALSIYCPLLAEYGINPSSVATMQEALAMLLENEYSGIVINGDDCEFMPLLKVMRTLTSSPIGISASLYDREKNDAAVKSGVDIYRVRYDAVEYRVKNFCNFIRDYHVNVRQKKSLPAIIHNDIKIFLDARKVIIKDMEVELQRFEFDILCYLLKNKGKVLTYGQIFNNVWGEEYANSSRKTLWCHICNLRKKMRMATKQPDFIKTKRGVGYIIS